MQTRGTQNLISKQMIHILTMTETRKRFMYKMKVELVTSGHRLGKMHRNVKAYCDKYSIPFERKRMKQIINELVINYSVVNDIKIIDPEVKKSKHMGGAVWNDLRTKLFSENENVCACCGSTEKLEADHIYPVSIYPELRLNYSNLQILCKSCNIRKGNRYVKKY